MRVLPILDTRKDQPNLSAAMNDALDKRGAEQFLEAHPEYHKSDANNAKMLGWIRQQGGCVSLKNLEVAFSILSEDGEIEDESTFLERIDYKVTPVQPTQYDKGVQKISTGLVLRHDTGGIGQNQLASEKPERMEELLGDVIANREAEDATNRKLAGSPGKPVHSKLAVKYHQSLGVNQRRSADNPYSEQYAEARSIIGLNYPKLKVDSLTFNRKVAELLESWG